MFGYVNFLVLAYQKNAINSAQEKTHCWGIQRMIDNRWKRTFSLCVYTRWLKMFAQSKQYQSHYPTVPFRREVQLITGSPRERVGNPAIESEDMWLCRDSSCKWLSRSNRSSSPGTASPGGGGRKDYGVGETAAGFEWGALRRATPQRSRRNQNIRSPRTETNFGCTLWVANDSDQMIPRSEM